MSNAADVLRDILGFHHFTTLFVNVLALIVGDVVKFEQLLADVEVAPFDLALRILDSLAHPRMLNGLAFLHAELLHQPADALGSKDAHEIVFQRQVETARTRIALTA